MDNGVGLILGNRVVDTRSEWRTFSNSDEGGVDPSRVGAASDPLLGGPNHLESTMIAMKEGGPSFAKDLNKTHARTAQVKTEKLLMQAFKEIQAMCERIGLSKIVVDSAKQLYKKVDDQKMLRGKTQEAIMAACIYIACREQNVTRTFKEICALTKVSKKEIGRCYKLLQPLFEKPAQQISLDSYISRFGSFLDLPTDVQKGTLIVSLFFGSSLGGE